MTKKEPSSKLNFQPLGERVLVKRLEAQNIAKGGIIIPDTAKQKQERATVVALGTGKTDKNGKLIPFPVKKGDVILMEKYSGQEVTINEEEYVILNSNDIIAIVEE